MHPLVDDVMHRMQTGHKWTMYHPSIACNPHRLKLKHLWTTDRTLERILWIVRSAGLPANSTGLL